MTRAMTRGVRLAAAIVTVSVVAVVIVAGRRLPTPARGVSTFPLSTVRVARRPVQARAGSEHRVHPSAGTRPPARAVPDRSGTRAEGREISELGEHRPRRAHDRPLPHGARADLGRDGRSGHEAATRLHGGRARRMSARERQWLRRGHSRRPSALGRDRGWHAPRRAVCHQRQMGALVQPAQAVRRLARCVSGRRERSGQDCARAARRVGGTSHLEAL